MEKETLTFEGKSMEKRKDILPWVKSQLGDLFSQTITKDILIATLGKYKDAKFSKSTKTPENSALAIYCMQIVLNHEGANILVDGVYKKDGETHNAIKEFQKKYTLTEDGIPGPETIGKMLEVMGTVVTPKPAPVVTPKPVKPAVSQDNEVPAI